MLTVKDEILFAVLIMFIISTGETVTKRGWSPCRSVDQQDSSSKRKISSGLFKILSLSLKHSPLNPPASVEQRLSSERAAQREHQCFMTPVP